MRINYCRVLYDMTIKNDSKFENESTCHEDGHEELEESWPE